MAIGHIAVRPHSRRKSHSAAAALAYRHAERLVDCRTGVIYDYRHRDVRDAELVAGGIAAHPAWDHGVTLTDRLQQLADRIERAERRHDARILRDIQPALPCELTEAQQEGLTKRFAQRLAKRYDTTVAWAVHRPKKAEGGDMDVLGQELDRRGHTRTDVAADEDAAAKQHHDDRNTHAHIVLPTRRVSWTGEFGDKLRQLDDRRGPQEVVEIRALWEETANEALEKAGSEARVHTGLRIDAPPEPTLGPRATRAQREAGREEAAAHRGAHGGRERRYAPALAQAIPMGLDALAQAERALKRRIAATRRQLAAVYRLIADAVRTPALRPAPALAGETAPPPAPSWTAAKSRAPPSQHPGKRQAAEARRKARAAAAEREKAFWAGWNAAEIDFREVLELTESYRRDRLRKAWADRLEAQPRPEPVLLKGGGDVLGPHASGFESHRRQVEDWLSTLPAHEATDIRESADFLVRAREDEARREREASAAAAGPAPRATPEPGGKPPEPGGGFSP